MGMELMLPGSCSCAACPLPLPLPPPGLRPPAPANASTCSGAGSPSPACAACHAPMSAALRAWFASPVRVCRPPSLLAVASSGATATGRASSAMPAPPPCPGPGPGPAPAPSMPSCCSTRRYAAGSAGRDASTTASRATAAQRHGHCAALTLTLPYGDLGLYALLALPRPLRGLHPALVQGCCCCCSGDSCACAGSPERKLACACIVILECYSRWRISSSQKVIHLYIKAEKSAAQRMTHIPTKEGLFPGQCAR